VRVVPGDDLRALEAEKKVMTFNVKCNVSKIILDVDTREGVLFLPDNNSPDMRSTIDSFRNIDPEIHTIYVYIGGVPDVCYVLSEESLPQWKAVYP
jgi:hypothetical protein